MRYEEMTSPQIDAMDRQQTVVLLPLGSVEQHGNHMPVGTDTWIAREVCLAAAARRPQTLVMPPPWYGFSAHHMQFAGSISLRPETMMALVTDIVGSLVQHGFSRILLVNGHGGNAGLVDVLSSTLGHQHYTTARIAGLTYFHLVRQDINAIRTSAAGGTGHAGEFETAMMMHLAAHLVHPKKAEIVYPDPGSTYLSTDLTGAGPIKTYHDFADLSASGTLGDPSLANPDKGKRFFDASAQALAAFVSDFARWPSPARPQ